MLGENLTVLEHIPAERSGQLGVQLDILVDCPVQNGLLGDNPQPGLVEDEQVKQDLLEGFVQHGAFVGEGADQALLELGSTSG